MAISVEVISRKGCGKCMAAKEKLAKAGYNVIDIDYDTIDRRPDRAELMASLIMSGMRDGTSVDFPIMRVLSNNWSHSTKEILEQAAQAAAAEKAHHPEFVKTVEEIVNGHVPPQLPERTVSAPENPEWRKERIALLAEDAVSDFNKASMGQTRAEGDPLDAAYLKMRECARTGGFAMGDFRELVSMIATGIGGRMAATAQRGPADLDQQIVEESGNAR